MKQIILIILCCICSLNIAANNLITDSGIYADQTESTHENFDIKDFLFSQTDTLSNAPTLIKHYADKHCIIGSWGAIIEIYPIELINLYTTEINSYIVLSINNNMCLLTGHDAASIIKALKQMQSYITDCPQQYEEGLTFNFPVNKQMLSFSFLRKKGKDDWKGLISLSSEKGVQYCYSANIVEKSSLLVLHLNSCINQIDERLKKPRDRKFIAQYGQQNEPSVFYYDYGNSTQHIVNYNLNQTLNGEYSNMLYEQKYDKKLYRDLYNIAKKSIWSPNATGRFGALEAYINRNGVIVHSKLYIDSNHSQKISKQNIYKYGQENEMCRSMMID
ncbi:MAG: hypothetical protein IKZ14_05680 [Muribaculaceae bacterium]|nr:hypothetical protein [Muribaculaceae bacterium]